VGQGQVSGNPAHSLTARAAADVRRLPAIRGPPGGAAPPWRRHPRERDRRKGKEQNPFTRIGTSTPGQLQWEPGREPKMGALEELDDPGALQPEREVTEHPTPVARKNCGPSRIPLEGS
jgi:hypothetical protein